jgi:KipI family sensor histidine kinase inhibitor
LVVSYDSLRTSCEDIENWVKMAIPISKRFSLGKTKTIEVPVLYGGEYGPDLEEVARLHSINGEEVVRLHSCETYTVYFIGFLPGFPYLGPLDTNLDTPRWESPRLEIKAGSVGIAGRQTGIYPLDSPGGWRIIGRTPLKLFDPGANPPARFSPGDKVRFIPLRDGKILP